MEDYSAFGDLKNLSKEFGDFSVDGQSEIHSSEGEEALDEEDSPLISNDVMAFQQGKVSAAKLASSVTGKKERHETAQKIIQELKNSKKQSAHRSALNNLEVDGVNSGAYSIEYTGNNIDNVNHASEVQKPTESRRKPNNRKDPNRKKYGDRKKKYYPLSSVKINSGFTHENQSSVTKSFNRSRFHVDDFSVCSPRDNCQEDSLELLLDESGNHTIRPCDRSHDLKVSKKKKLKNHMKVQRSAQEVDDFIDSSTVRDKFCGAPCSSYGRHEDKSHQSKGIPGERFSYKTNGFSGAPNYLHCQPFFQFESVTDSELVSSDAYPFEETPLLRSPYGNQNSSFSSFDDQCGFGLATSFGDLDLYNPNKIHRRTRKSGARECITEKESTHTKTFEHTSIHRSLSQKYSPKSFKELVGHTIVAHALCNAVSKGKIAPFYLFHGPRGTGKTSTGRLFGKALNCMAACNAKPCGNCNGCSKSPEIKEMDAASRCVDTERMKIFLQSIKFSHSVPHFQVFIVDECQILTPEAWTVLLNGLEEKSSSVVFIMITTDAKKLPRIALSRCQKFHFPKLKDSDIYGKLAMIAATEDIDIEQDALHLISVKADGSLRDAEITLDELSLLGTNVTKEMVNQFVGLVPDERLVTLLGLALSADTLGTVRSIREIIESGVQPLVLVEQLASLITDILAGTCIQSAWLQEKETFCRGFYSSKDETKRLRRALKILLETEKQLNSSNDHTTWITAALLQFAPDDIYQFYTPPLNTSLIQSPVALLDTIEKEAIDLEHPAEEHLFRNDRWEHYQLELELIPPKISEATTNMNSTVPPSPFVSDIVPENVANHFQTRKYIHQRSHSSSHSQKLQVIFENVSGIAENNNLHAHTLDSLADAREAGQRELKLMSLGDTEQIWQKVLEKFQSSHLKELLEGRGKLSSVFLSKASAVVHLKFKHRRDKEQAERSETSLSNAFNEVLGFPVEVKIRLRHDTGDEHENSESSADDFSKNQEDMPRGEEKKILTSKAVRRQNTRTVKIWPRYRRRNRIAGMLDKMRGPSESDTNILQVSSEDDEVFEKCSIDRDNLNRKDIPKTEEQFNDVHPHTEDLEQRSSASIGINSFSFEQAEGSVDAYSQDLVFDHVSSRRKHSSGRRIKLDMSFKEAKKAGSYPIPTNMAGYSKHRSPFHRKEIHINQHKWKQRSNKLLLKFAPCTDSSIAINASLLKKGTAL
ncbi:hypothetical protein SUGI_0438200 [Cryptomeria japonica]|nr:hypothetical protein SUGI_0438200 [Cryptomeria japonica]